MAGYHYSADFPDPRGTMETLALLGEARRGESPLPVPNEIMMEILKNLIRAHSLFNPVYVDSMALTSAKNMRKRLRRLCLVSRRMRRVAMPYLYQLILITDSNKLARLHETLEKYPVLYAHLESLAVHQNIVSTETGEEHYMSLSESSYTIVSILEKAPRLVRLSLVPTGVEAEEDSYEQLFLPRVETLGVLLSDATRLERDKSSESTTFSNLLSLRIPSPNAVQEGQPSLAPSNSITFLDLRGDDPVDWRDIGAISLFFPCLSSLSTWYTIQHWSRLYLPARWELAQMSSLRHLSIAIHARNRYSDWSWERGDAEDDPEQAFDLRVLPNLETLKIPLRLFMEPDGESMRRSRHVLPATLKTLVLFVDLQPNTAEPLYSEESQWVDDGFGYSVWYPRSCAQSLQLTIEFLNDIKRCARRRFPNLRELTVEYEEDDYTGGRDRSFRDAAMGEFMARLQKFGASFERKRITFRSIAL